MVQTINYFFLIMIGPEVNLPFIRLNPIFSQKETESGAATANLMLSSLTMKEAYPCLRKSLCTLGKMPLQHVLSYKPLAYPKNQRFVPFVQNIRRNDSAIFID